MTEIRFRTWVFYKGAGNISPRMLLRYHREGWCSSDAPFGVRVGPRRSYKGNPNDFECLHCGEHFTHVDVDRKVAARLRTLNVDDCTSTNAVESIAHLPVSTWLWGCDCITGYEHAQRQCVEPAPTGSVQGEVVGLTRVTVMLAPTAETKVENVVETPAEDAHLSHTNPMDPTDPANPYTEPESLYGI